MLSFGASLQKIKAEVEGAFKKLSDEFTSNKALLQNHLQFQMDQSSPQSDTTHGDPKENEETKKEPTTLVDQKYKETPILKKKDGELSLVKDDVSRPMTGDAPARVNVDKTKVHVAFCGFLNCGKTSLIRSITGEVATLEPKTIKKSKSQNYMDTSTSMIPFRFKNPLNDIILWEVSYPFSHPLQHTAATRKQLRTKLMKEFFASSQLQLFSIIFVCIDCSDIKEEDFIFAKVVHEQGIEPVFINTKCDERLLEYCRELKLLNDAKNRKEFLEEERMVFSCQVMCQAPELKNCKNFYINSKSVSGLCKVMAGCEENNNENGEDDEDIVERNWRDFELEERKLLSFIQENAPAIHFGNLNT